jgi:hypothetical protein
MQACLVLFIGPLPDLCTDSYLQPRLCRLYHLIQLCYQPVSRRLVHSNLQPELPGVPFVVCNLQRAVSLQLPVVSTQPFLQPHTQHLHQSDMQS